MEDETQITDVSLDELQSLIDTLSEQLEDGNSNTADISAKLDQIVANQQKAIEQNALLYDLINGQLDAQATEISELSESVSDDAVQSQFETDVLNQLTGINTCFYVLFVIILLVGVLKFFKIFF